jgi:hypothetical protein
MKKKITCKTGLKKNIINKKIFDREIELCSKLSKKNKGKCGWGKCKDCGVIPLLVKLYRGRLIDDPEDIKGAKNAILK